MIPFETITFFFMTSLALALVPGPDNIFVLTQSAMHGRIEGMLVTIGLCTGILVHTIAVSFGVAAIFQTSTLAFNILKIVGVLYLLYLAWRAFRTGTADIDTAKSAGVHLHGLYYRGVIMNITNPKVAIFFLAFLPQFTDPSTGSIVIQMIMLGGVFVLATLIIFFSIAWSSGFLGDRLKRSPQTQVVMNRLAGTVLIALALKLSMSER
jgi:threonine/homoserine/homoserine lactone efflux protein